MRVKGPKLWQSIKLIKTKSDGSQEDYVSKIVGVEKDEHYIVDNPSKKTQLVMFVNGSKLTMAYLLENKDMHMFDVEVVGKMRDGKIPLLKLKKISDINKIQRRNYYRLDTIIDLTLRKETDIIEEKTTTVNISGGGMRILSKQEFQIGDKVVVDFNMNESENRLKAKVVKLEYVDYSRTDVCIEFIELMEKKRNEIIRFIFEKQREELQKGLSSNG